MTGALKILFFIGDLIILNAAILLSTGILGDSDSQSSTYLLAFSNLSWLFLVMVSTPYNMTKGWTVSKVIKSQFAFIFIHLLVVASLVLLFKQKYEFFQIISIYLIIIPSLSMFRVIVLYLRRVVNDDVYKKNFIIIGRNQLAQDVRKFFLMNPAEGFKFVQHFDLPENDDDINKLQEIARKWNVNEIYCCIPNVSNENLKRLLSFGLDSLIKVKFVMSTPASGSIQLAQFDQLPGIDLVSIPLDSQWNQAMKRIFDIIFSLTFILLVMSWLVPLIGLLIKLDSKGPIFFTQLRSGEKNRPFKCFKFRTMVVNTDSDTKQATKHDSRITPLGRFLRKSSIDELPQFFNVLNGTMSVVGPRPHMLKHTEEYSQLIDKFMGRHYVKAGITGLAQCLGYRGETQNLSDMENRVRLDRYYIENWTFWFDIKIIFLTVISLIRGSEKAF
jgi:putative colanic acid biosysnthesis UDP-glucose lipid carrier transferase